MDQGPGKTFPDGPAGSVKKEAATSNTGGGERTLRYLPSSGMQRSANPKKDQPRTMRFLKG